MINKQTLMLKRCEDTEIITVNRSTCSYVDENWFSTQVGENKKDKSSLTFAVKFWCIRADWIIND